MTDLERRDAVRVGTAERQAAGSRLEEHLIAGRLDPQEFSDRLEAAHLATHRHELDLLFTDLPKTAGLASSGVLPRLRVRRRVSSRRLLTWTVGALSPFIALLCFFAVHQSAAWFLLIPLTLGLAQLADRQPASLSSARRRRRY